LTLGLNYLVVALTLTSGTLSAQLSYQSSKPLRYTPPNAATSKAAQSAVKPRPRFRGWKHTADTKAFRSCGTACFSGAPATPAVRAGQLATLSVPTFSSFNLRPTLPAGLIPTSIAIGDFNGDGHLDWVVSNGGENDLWLYLGRGDGTIPLPTIIPLAGAAPLWVIAADLRGNGKLDLVVAEADSQTIGVLLGNGDGTFQAEAEYAAPSTPLFVLAADFNGDSKLDIAVGMGVCSETSCAQTIPIATLFGDGQGHLGSAITTPGLQGSEASWMAAADLNGDGKLDLIVTDPADALPDGGAQVYLNNGNGTFTAGQVFFHNYFEPPPGQPELAMSVALTDLTGDGCADAVVSDTYGLVSVYAGNCAGMFNTTAFSHSTVGDIGVTLQLIDMNHDGKLDVVTSGAVISSFGGIGIGAVAGNDVSVLLGDGTGHFGSGRVYRGEPSMYGLAVGDVNGDGYPDVVTANQDSNSVSVFLNDGNGGFGDPQGEPIGYSSGAINAPVSPFLFADVDGNGTQDIVVMEYPPLYPGTMQITTMLNDGTGKFAAPVQSPAWPEGQPPGDIVLADFRNTGRPDLLAIGLPVSSLYFAPNIGGGKFGQTTLLSPAGASGLLAVGDFNGDGKLDFVALTGNDYNNVQQTARLSIFLGNGDGTFNAGPSFLFGDANGYAMAVAVFVGDFNRDGKLDILAVTDGLYEILGNGDGTFQPARLLFPTFGVLALADVNRDGWPDIIAMTDQFGNPATFIPTISVFIGQADGSFQFSQTYTPYLDALRQTYLVGTNFQGQAIQGLVGDFNGDGNPDVALFQDPWEGQANTFVQVLFGNGDGTFTPSYVSYPLNKIYIPQFAADVNGDGLADLIEMDNYASSFNVVKSISGAPGLQIKILTNPVTGGAGWARLVLNAPSATATTVSLTASDPNILLPSLLIPAGSVTQEFQFTIDSGFNAKNVFSIQAQTGVSTAVAYADTSTVPAPIMELDPSAVFFGYGNAGSAIVQSMTLRNIGSAPLTPLISVTAPWLSETDNCGNTVAAGGSCTIQVSLTVGGGLASGELAVFDDNFGLDQRVDLEGFGLALQIVPCCLYFQTNVDSTTPPQTITLTNQETIPLQITSQLYPPGEGFTEVNNCGTLASGASCQFTVTFSPPQSGPDDDSLMISESSTLASEVYLNGDGSDFALNATVGSATINAGQTATYQLTAASLFGFAGAVSLACSGAPQAATCSVSPASVNVTSDQSPNFTVTVATTARTTSSLAPKMPPKRPALPWPLVDAILVGIVVRVPQRRKRSTTILSVLLALLMCSCGGGGAPAGSAGGGGGGGNGSTSGTPSGNYTVTITGTSGGVAHTAGVLLTVN
jgi:hypothetical protein